MLPAGIGEPARGIAAGRDDPDQSAPLANRQQSGRCSLQKLIAINQAVIARNFVEPLEGGAERAQRYQVGFLANSVGANQHPLCADADRFGATFRGGKDPTRQQMADASKLRTTVR